MTVKELDLGIASIDNISEFDHFAAGHGGQEEALHLLLERKLTEPIKFYRNCQWKLICNQDILPVRDKLEKIQKEGNFPSLASALIALLRTDGEFVHGEEEEEGEKSEDSLVSSVKPSYPSDHGQKQVAFAPEANSCEELSPVYTYTNDKFETNQPCRESETPQTQCEPLAISNNGSPTTDMIPSPLFIEEEMDITECMGEDIDELLQFLKAEDSFIDQSYNHEADPIKPTEFPPANLFDSSGEGDDLQSMDQNLLQDTKTLDSVTEHSPKEMITSSNTSEGLLLETVESCLNSVVHDTQPQIIDQDHIDTKNLHTPSKKFNTGIQDELHSMVATNTETQVYSCVSDSSPPDSKVTVSTEAELNTHTNIDIIPRGMQCDSSVESDTSKPYKSITHIDMQSESLKNTAQMYPRFCPDFNIKLDHTYKLTTAKLKHNKTEERNELLEHEAENILVSLEITGGGSVETKLDGDDKVVIDYLVDMDEMLLGPSKEDFNECNIQSGQNNEISVTEKVQQMSSKIAKDPSVSIVLDKENNNNVVSVQNNLKRKMVSILDNLLVLKKRKLNGQDYEGIPLMQKEGDYEVREGTTYGAKYKSGETVSTATKKGIVATYMNSDPDVSTIQPCHGPIQQIRDGESTVPQRNDKKTYRKDCPQCRYCLRRFDTSFRLKLHLRRQNYNNVCLKNMPDLSKIYTCHFCDEAFYTLDMLRGHHTSKKCNLMPTGTVISFCKEQKSTTSDRIEQTNQAMLLGSNSSRTVFSDECNTIIEKELDTSKSGKFMGTEEKTPQFCDLCKAAFHTYQEFQDHLRSHFKYDPFSCTLCDARFYKTSSLTHHLTTCHKQQMSGQTMLYSCGLCPSTFEKESLLVSHSKRHLIPANEHCVSCTLACDFCNEVFHKAALIAHLAACPAKGQEKSPTFVKALQAGKVCKKPYLSVETPEPCFCVACSLQFRNEFFLNKHLQDVHGEDSDNPVFPCDLCKTVSLSYSHFKNHMTSHFKYDPYTCGVCNAKFSRICNISHHSNTVHLQETGNLSKSFACGFCIESFSESPSLLCHVRRHMVKAKKYVRLAESLASKKEPLCSKAYLEIWDCDICSEKFADVSRFHDHLEVHKQASIT